MNDPQTAKTRTERPTVFHVLPRGMRYDVASATSIDLFVSEVAAHSRFRVEVVAEASASPLAAEHIHQLPRYGIANSLRRSRWIADLARSRSPALVVVQQHLPSAADVARRLGCPVVLQRHNYMRTPNRSNWLGAISAARRERQMNTLAGMTFVSSAVMTQFERDWPDVEIARRIVPNGVDFREWTPAAQRANLILIVGRATEEKGLVDAAQALNAVLPRSPDWSATLVVSEPDRDPRYFAALRAALSPLGDRARLLVNRPFADVKLLNERAAIALVPSKWREPFGRTCLEAHAGGAAVISSGSGGLREISGEAALFLPEVSAAAIAESLQVLISEETLRRRLAFKGAARVRDRFDISRISADFDDFCSTVMAKRQ